VPFSWYPGIGRSSTACRVSMPLLPSMMRDHSCGAPLAFYRGIPAVPVTTVTNSGDPEGPRHILWPGGPGRRR
jgi:hypothetical protein